jgi:putative alpha-1,2-mannosidase
MLTASIAAWIKKFITADGFDYYTVFSLWDTFRAEHPLLTLIDKKRTLDFIKSFLAIYDQQQLLPIWSLASNETYCMIGNHAIPVIVDAYAKGIRDFDALKALDAMKSVGKPQPVWFGRVWRARVGIRPITTKNRYQKH